MGKVSYRPKRGNRGEDKKRNNEVRKEIEALEEREEVVESVDAVDNEEVHEEVTKLTIMNTGGNEENIQSTKIVGELGNDYHVYIEDYVYTYLYQLAAADYTKESSAVLIGQSYSDSKEVLIKGIIPIDMDKLQKDSEWIDMNVIDEIEMQRQKYFEGQQIIGWMHMQPGYGTMLTMKEVREHQNVFEGNGTVCMLVDAINKIETLFVYEEDELKEQSGYCMYYERNEQMQQYMLDHPFSKVAKEEMKDNVVNQFREIGKARKAEYMQRKNLNLTVMVASVILIAITAVIVKMNDSNAKIKDDQQVVSSTIMTSAAPEQVDQSQLIGEQPAIEALATQDETAAEGEVTNTEKEVADQEGALEENKEVADKTQEDQEVDPDSYDIYVVKAGDTLADICYAHYGSAERSAEVAAFNKLSNTNALYVGEELKMPK